MTDPSPFRRWRRFSLLHCETVELALLAPVYTVGSALECPACCRRCGRCDTPVFPQRLLGKDVRPSAELRKVLSPEFAPISVRVDLINVCQNEELSAVPQQTVTTEPEPDQPPIRRKHFDLIEAQVGRLLRLQVSVRSCECAAEEYTVRMTL